MQSWPPGLQYLFLKETAEIAKGENTTLETHETHLDRHGSWPRPMLWSFSIFITVLTLLHHPKVVQDFIHKDSLSGWCHRFSLIFESPCSSQGSLWGQWPGSLLSCFFLLNTYHCESSTLVTCTCYWSTLLIQPILWYSMNPYREFVHLGYAQRSTKHYEPPH